MNYKAAKSFILEKLERELPVIYTYHGIHHTLDVLAVTKSLCAIENVSELDTVLLKTAALFHDAGFTEAATNHEILGCAIAKKHLPLFDYNEEAIEKICGMIMATKIPQTPQTHLEEILADADLDYLGRTDFYHIGNTLFEELKTLGVLENSTQWNRLQVKFLEAHRYHTITNILRREPAKRIYLHEIKENLS